MAILIRTGDIPPAERYDAWRSTVCDTLGPLDFRADPGVPLWGEIGAGSLGPINVGSVLTSTPHSVHRTPGLIRRGSSELYRVVLAISGALRLGQGDKTARLLPGDFAIYDFAKPYELVYDSAVRLAVFGFPRVLLPVPAEIAAVMTAVPITAEVTAAGLAAPFLTRVAKDYENYQPASTARLCTVLMDLVATAVAERAGAKGSVLAASRERALLHAVHAFIERNLGDAELTPAVIASAHHVSLRQLHRLFETQETTVAAWIRHRRLERCRRDLSDPCLATMPVSTVAARWGLADPAHFSRLFRAAYSVAPAEFRQHSLER